MYGAGLKPLKALGTSWIDQNVRAMCWLVEKFIQVHRSHNTSRKDTKLMDGKVLLRCTFFTDILAEAKCFSMITQEESIKMFDAVETGIKL